MKNTGDDLMRTTRKDKLADDGASLIGFNGASKRQSMKWQLKTFIACVVLQKLLCALITYKSRNK